MAQKIRAKQVDVDIIIANGTHPFTADQSMGGFKLTNLADPVAATDAANKRYVDSLAQGVAWKNPVRASTTGVLPSVTYANGSGGVGATLTGTANGALPAQDGVTLAVGERLLVKDQAAALQNGIYVVTDAGSVSTPFILTRATDADTGTELLNAATFVEEGTTNADTMWVDTTDAPITVGTTGIVFVMFSTVNSLIAGAGLVRTGNQLDIELDTTPGLEFDVAGVNGKLRVKVDPNGGIQRVAAGIGLKLDGDSLSTSASGVKAAVPTASDKYRAPTAGSGNFQSTGLTISFTPGGDGMVDIRVNGVSYELGQGVKTKDCYFSGDGGATARAIAAIVAGDTLYWNGTIAGFDLDASDRMDFIYNVA